MQSLSHSQLKTLIQLESQGKITPKEIYKRCALAKVQKQDILSKFENWTFKL